MTNSNRKSKTIKPENSAPRKRLGARSREQQIIDESISFFAEKGFTGKTRELASRLGFTQPLLYRYFPTKQDLIDRVFEEVYLNRIKPDWIVQLQDRSRPLEERLCEFYTVYSQATYRYEWIRIYMFSALMGEKLNQRYIKLIENEILTPICLELRDYYRLPDCEPVSQVELDHVWVTHGGLFYYAVRKHIYHSRVGNDFSAIVSRAISTMLAGSKTIFSDQFDDA